jgi:predicted DNA-binding protein with PD1-like motif
VHVIQVDRGEEVLETVTRKAKALGIENGAVVSLIGAVASAAISNMAADDDQNDIVTEYAQPMELSGTGEITDGTVHLHVVLGAEGDQALAGHLHRAVVETFFVRAYVIAS